MVAVINHLHFTKPVEEFRESIEQEAIPLISSLSGFRDFHFIRVAENRAIVFLFWETAADAQNVAAQFSPTRSVLHGKDKSKD